MRPATDTGTLRAGLAAVLAEARERTWRLVDPLTDEDLRRQHDALMSPVLWDLGHIGQFESLWLVRNTQGPVTFAEMPGLYDPFEHPRAARGGLPLPGKAEMRAMLDGLRAEALTTLEGLDLEGDDPLLQDGYVVRMVAQHEYQHGETILQTLQLKTGAPYAAPRGWSVPDPSHIPEAGAMVRFPGGEVQLGTDDRTAAYDNERPAHRVALSPFWIDVTPVRNAEFLAFMEAGGYTTRAWWSDEGWRWLQSAGVRAPKHWLREGGEWRTRSMDRVTALDPRRPVCHVCWHEAEAYARWAGKRLPTEAEWEAAAGWDPATGTMRAYPWGGEPPTRALANVDQLAFDTAPVGAYPRNVSPIGCHGMIGDVWEWTASPFTGYPGFEPFPYPEYSEAFFGDEYRVLRGGSWATRPGAIRNSFRNWDYPIRRQIFAGFRCARDA